MEGVRSFEDATQTTVNYPTVANIAGFHRYANVFYFKYITYL